MKRIAIGGGLILLALLGASCTGTGPADDLTPVTVMLDWVPNTNHSGLFVAEAEGYFEEAGLKVDIIQPGEVLAEQAVAGGAADYGISFQEQLTLARADEVPIVSIAAILQHNTSGFASLRPREVVSPSGWEGLQYGSFGSPFEEPTLRVLMECDEGDFSKLDIIDIGYADPLALLSEKKIDLAWIFTGWQGIQAILEGISLDVIMMDEWFDCVPDYYTPIIIASETTLSERPELTSAFLGAVSRGYDYAIKNPVEAADILLEAVPELDENLVRASQAWLSSRYQADAARWGEQSVDTWSAYADWMVQHGIIATPIDAEAAFTNDFLPPIDEVVGPYPPFIAIIEPRNEGVVPVAEPFIVFGSGAGLFENNIVVRAYDVNEKLLAEEVTILDTEEEGGPGTWQVEFTVQAEPGTTGRIIALSSSPEEGEPAVSADVPVTFGVSDEATPTESPPATATEPPVPTATAPEEQDGLEDHLWKLTRLDGSAPIENTMITAQFQNGQLTGSSGCNPYTGSYEKSGGSLSIGSIAVTELHCDQPNGVMEQERGYLTVLPSATSYRIENGALQLIDAAGRTLEYAAAVTGAIVLSDQDPLQEGSTVEIKLQDVSIADAAATTIGETIIHNPGQPPIPFSVTYNADIIDPRLSYGVQVRITNSEGKLMYINTTAYPVITQGHPSEITVTVDRVN